VTLNETFMFAYWLALPAMVLVIVVKIMWDGGTK